MNKLPAFACLVSLAALTAGCTSQNLIASNARAAPVEERTTPPGQAPVQVVSVDLGSNESRSGATANPAPAVSTARSTPAAVRPAPGIATSSQAASLPPPTPLGQSVASQGQASVSPANTADLVTRPQPIVGSDVVPEPPASPAARTLVAQGQQLQRDGDFEKAAASFERALEIAPADPWLWHRLASVRAAQGQKGLARALATRSNALGPSDNNLARANASFL
jgi:hypothetical protein